MRAIYLDQHIFENESMVLTGEKVHHLNNVLRIKVGEEILLLDGKGSVFKGVVFQISKKEIKFNQIEAQVKHYRKYHISLAIAQVKKEAMDLILKASCELGIETIYILETEYSQRYKLNLERIEKLLISALEQSNNPFLPQIVVTTLDNLELHKFDNIFLFSTEKQTNVQELRGIGNKSNLVIIGPEAGFSLNEIAPVEKQLNSYLIQLPTPIMRASTAVNCAVGYLLGRIELDS